MVHIFVPSLRPSHLPIAVAQMDVRDVEPSTIPFALVVTSEALLALEIEDLLSPKGFQVRSALSEEAAMDANLDGVVVAIVHLRLTEKLTGQTVIRELRKRVPNLPVVVITGYDALAPQADLRGLGGPTVRLHMPDHHRDLTTIIRSLLEEPPGEFGRAFTDHRKGWRV